MPYVGHLYKVPISPVYVSFPLLPIHFRAKSELFTIARDMGLSLCINKALSDLRRPERDRYVLRLIWNVNSLIELG